MKRSPGKKLQPELSNMGVRRVESLTVMEMSRRKAYFRKMMSLVLRFKI